MSTPVAPDAEPQQGAVDDPDQTIALAPSPATDQRDEATLIAPRPEAQARPADEQPLPRGAQPRAADDSEREERPERKGFVGFLRELPVLLVVAFVLALLIKTFLVQAFYIPSASMEPTLQIGDRVLVNKVVYHLHPPRRGDVIVFSDPEPTAEPDRGPVSAFLHWLTDGLGVTSNPEKDFIKRVIGLPGDVIEVDRRGVVHVNGKPLEEPYLKGPEDRRRFGPVTVPANSVFVMGDNRPNSRDSRFGLGYIPYDHVVGRAFVVIWPPSRVQWLHGL